MNKLYQNFWLTFQLDCIARYEKLLKAGYSGPAGYENLAFGRAIICSNVRVRVLSVY